MNVYPQTCAVLVKRDSRGTLLLLRDRIKNYMKMHTIKTRQIVDPSPLLRAYFYPTSVEPEWS